jgi:hypothetical protein
MTYMSTMHIFAPLETQPWTNLSYLGKFVASRGPPRLLLTRYCQPTGRRKALRPLPTKWAICWIPFPLEAISKMPSTLQVPSVPQEKSKPGILVPAKATFPAPAAGTVGSGRGKASAQLAAARRRRERILRVLVVVVDRKDQKKVVVGLQTCRRRKSCKGCK